MYELLSGVHPFRKPKQVDTTNAILSENPSPLSRYTEDTADLLQLFYQALLQKSLHFGISGCWGGKGSDRNLLILLAPQVGLEPTTLRLTAGCSAN